MKIRKVLNYIVSSKDYKEIFFKSTSSLIFRVLSYLLGFLFTLIITKNFNPSTQGVFTISFTIVSLISLVSKLGIQTAMVKWLSNFFYLGQFGEAKHLFFKIFRLTLILSIIITTILFHFSEFIAISFFNKPSLINPFKTIVFCIPFFTSIDIIANYFRSKKNIVYFSFYTFTCKFLFPLILLTIFVFFLEKKTPEIVIYSYSFGIILIGIIAIFHVFYDLKNINRIKSVSFNYKKILKTSIPLLFSSSLVMLMWWSDTFILGKYKSEAEVGIYSVSAKIATIVSFVYSAVISILMPKIAQYYKNSEEIKLKKVIQYSSKMVLITTLPIALIFLFFPKMFLTFFGEGYELGSQVLILLVIAQLTNSLTGPVGPFLSMSGHEKQQLYFILISLIINLAVSLLLVNKYGSEGVAFGSALGMMVWNILGAIYIKRNLGYRTWIKLKL